MAKDPAILWYWNDWYSGTILMNRFLKGCYMDLLHAQFNHGPLSLDEVKTILGSDFAQAWVNLQKKFSVNPDGLFFNERMECEKIKREQFSLKQKERVNKRWNKSGIYHGNTTVLPLLENRNENSSFGKCENLFLKTFPEIEEVERVFLQQGGTKEMAKKFHSRYEAVNWKIRGTPVENFAHLVGGFIENWRANHKVNGHEKQQVKRFKF